MRLRKEYSALATGKSLDLLDAEQQYVYARVSDKHTLVIALNNDTEASVIEFEAGPLQSQT